MKIGVIVATIQEITETRKILENVISKNIFDLVFYEGRVSENEVILVRCGVGKVNAARTAQILIDKYNVDCVINIGAAGGIDSELNIKDIVIGDSLVQYDFDISALGNSTKGELDGIGKFIKSDTKLVNICKNILENLENRDFNYKIGTIATADIFCADSKIAKEIHQEFGAECVEMEGAAIAQVCFLDNVPFLVIRGISDSPNGNNGIDYSEYCNIAAKQATNILEELIKNYMK